jgi:hypothetical protein
MEKLEQQSPKEYRSILSKLLIKAQEVDDENIISNHYLQIKTVIDMTRREALEQTTTNLSGSLEKPQLVVVPPTPEKEKDNQKQSKESLAEPTKGPELDSKSRRESEAAESRPEKKSFEINSRDKKK